MLEELESLGICTIGELGDVADAMSKRPSDLVDSALSALHQLIRREA